MEAKHTESTNIFSKSTPSRIMGCHNPLSAKLAEEVGFDAVWFSGFEYSTSMCIPDASLLTMSDHLNMISSITRAIEIPLIADCDSGFGDANNVAYMVKEYERAGVSAVCIEDKLFPKLNSFCENKQELISIDEFCLKIIAATRTRTSSQFMIIARLESFIAGLDVRDAIMRAKTYIKAGADAILVHSKLKDTSQIEAFFNSFDLCVPVIVIPTTYCKVTMQELQSLSPKIKGIIYANHGIRASIGAMQRTFREIITRYSSSSVEDRIATIEDAFAYQGMSKYIKNYSLWRDYHANPEGK